MVNFQLGKIYKIVCNETGLIYIGSTCEPTLAKRLTKHKANYKRWLDGKKQNYTTSFKIFEKNNCDIVLIKDFPCERKEQLHAEERIYIETINCVNKNIPLRTKAEYRQDNEVDIKAYKKKYRKENADAIREYNKKYKEEKNK